MAVLTRRGTTKNLVAFSVRIPPEIKAKVESLAYHKGQTMGLTVEQIITAAVADTEDGQKTAEEEI